MPIGQQNSGTQSKRAVITSTAFIVVVQHGAGIGQAANPKALSDEDRLKLESGAGDAKAQPAAQPLS